MIILPDRINEQANSTLRPISIGAEKWLYRPIQCLDHGYVYLVDYMGNDEAIAEAARTSYGKGTKQIRRDRGLIRYLRRHVHTGPSEMVEFKFHCKMPIFVARQWIRHRTANVNEYSGRYSEMLDEFYLPSPEVIRRQSKTNRQGRGDELDPETQATVLELLKSEYEGQFKGYKKLLELDVAKELARIGLSLASYTQWYWKLDLHNLMHFLRLRLDAHAQYEIRVYAQAMATIINDAVPASFEAFEDYQLYALTFSRLELDILSQNQWPKDQADILKIGEDTFGDRLEAQEFLEKLRRVNFVI
ncbi:MAG: hypothetical protein A2568_02735 [Candidatus Yanofskybacteria bacterium RIFOXYD1_FULL_44_17]|uniref:Flavin-dependent thymidylate synthase n=1 Tax=Candidatus Yanofskybacteria bacterium GW2011_GWE2_40_11 TaxID=1619033 RepID=A0A0G0QU90_9BACT|nr:MAG: Thymidylate synthase ThyX [Candidatus Yanofskybacteria bacterium GW2011_GWE1_40_10]KKR40916.1 MAG: Thymidylate synthase ThyX [Candidatus Yanofskybacteria bacterium GW2011_GWE2_40_11]OGN35388.1 MAG: hypothetical protein A2207_00135 [Candidatus Yanofskybacteria bacterium RIFOXYA1_FULL_44_17]OGN36523.1 MAG: hypothetical protein A2241_02170 [Candidatus Yanofskybacteria bacterium RIFOXYA2_FULL_45_28]OGN37135.1 MAG: hypothetical protein A2405_03540 [Candidatus Yanofskybacteria bacterium RIFOX